MSATTVSPIAALQSAEASLIQQIQAATQRVAAVGTVTMEAALAELRVQVTAAQARLSSLATAALTEVNELARFTGGLASADIFGLAAPEVTLPTLAEIAAEPIPVCPDCGAPTGPSSHTDGCCESCVGRRLLAITDPNAAQVANKQEASDGDVAEADDRLDSHANPLLGVGTGAPAIHPEQLGEQEAGHSAEEVGRAANSPVESTEKPARKTRRRK